MLSLPTGCLAYSLPVYMLEEVGGWVCGEGEGFIQG